MRHAPSRRHPSIHKATPVHEARLRIRRRPLPLRELLPTLRWMAVTTLIICLVVGGLRWLASPDNADALEFTPKVIDNATVGVLGVAMGDIDGDNDTDIATAGTHGVKVYENTGKNTFTLHIIDEARTERIQIVDLNKDGSPDLLASLNGTSALARWYRNNGELDFSPTTLTPAGSPGTNAIVYAGDIDGDTAPDIAAARTVGEAVIISRWMNDGVGNFTETVLNSDSKVKALTIGDVDGNGYRDIVTAGGAGLQRWNTNDAVTWERIDIDDQTTDFASVAVGDSPDGRVLIVTGDIIEDMVAVYRSSGDGKFQRLEVPGNADAKNVFPVDFEGDGDLDVIVAAQDDNSIFWYENVGSDTWTKQTLATGLQSVYSVSVADIDGDNDLDFVAGDHFQGKLYLYERIRALPIATAASSITQSQAGSGVVSFQTTISDGDLDPTRVRVQYSLDGKTWYKPWITKVTPNVGSVDLKNSNEYQVGSNNPIDTDTNASVTLTFNWDTKSVENTGGPLNGDYTSVKLRFIPRDAKSISQPVVSSAFEVDNKGPTGLQNFRLTSINGTDATLSWTKPTDNSSVTYKIYYGTNTTSVLEEKSDVWDSGKDEKLADIDTTTTTITGLTANKSYTFKLVATDQYGNKSVTASVRGTTTTSSGSTSTTTPPPSGTTQPGETTTPTPTVDFGPGATVAPSTAPIGSATPTPTSGIPGGTIPPSTFQPTPTKSVPSVLFNNQAPIADAGADQIVNPSALVILDGTGSFDPDRDSLAYSWRQIEGPKIELTSSRTATPSFTAEGENQTYIFEVTVQDPEGASAVDFTTVVTRALPPGAQASVSVAPIGPNITQVQQASPLVRTILHPSDLFLFILSLLSTGFLVVERVIRRLRDGNRAAATTTNSLADRAQPQGKVIHHKTGEPIVNAQVLIYGQDGKLRSTQRTNSQGVFGTFFPPGEYTIGVQAEGFAVSVAGNTVAAPEGSLIYTGGKLTVKDQNKPLSLLIPMKPVGAEISSSRVQLLHAWQAMQRLGRLLSWPIILAGALLNTTLVFIAPRPLYLVIEVLYIALVILKIALEVRVRPAYGQVRDAITHIPLDLAVVRLFQEGTNRLVMTRVTNNQGKFFALPPAGKYTITITKPGYATFSKHNVELKSEHDTTLQMTADLMPVAPPTGGLQQARAATI